MHRTRLLLLLALAALAALTGAAAGAETGPGGRSYRPPAVEGFLVAPYLNDPGPDRMRVMFEPAPVSAARAARASSRSRRVRCMPA